MLDLTKKSLPKEATLEGLIQKLDSRGLLVLQVLIGQQAMAVLAEEKLNTISLSKPGLHNVPNAFGNPSTLLT